MTCQSSPFLRWLLYGSEEGLGLLSQTGQDPLPVVGFDRNQPFRRFFSTLPEEPSLERLDPAVVYHLPEGSLVRPASVEGWIENCQERFPGRATRDLWETVWNVAACTWNILDEYWSEPWTAPILGFPWTAPAFWQELSRNRWVLLDSRTALQRLGVDPDRELGSLVGALIGFAYGLPMNRVPFGMACLALNSPSESYRAGALPERTGRAGVLRHPVHPKGSLPGFSVPFNPGDKWLESGCPIQQTLFSMRPGDTELASAVWVVAGPLAGEGYLRSSLGAAETASVLKKILSAGWGAVEEVESARERSEAEWPWLGPVRAFLSSVTKPSGASG